ncbi:MAG TPA: carbohydrate kinase [Pyrinomonadaceae bacterium]|nr:carbohydrate kinase [Pyrinomonadaceae bacterium]
MKSSEYLPNGLRPRWVVGLGELIWDMLPEGKQLGGAPANFAYISSILGNRVAIASRVGPDQLGREAQERLERMSISTDYLQVDGEHPTGTVGVEIGARGEAHFAVNENSAWDYLAWTDEWEQLARRADAVCFGTLGQRQPQARETILRFLGATCADAVRVFDVNLRHSFFTPELLKESLGLATIVKLSSEELTSVARLLALDAAGEEALAQKLMLHFEVKLVAVTRGERGSLLVSGEEIVNHPGLRVMVRDTIGAGDAFTATLAHYYMRGAPLEVMSEAANRMGAWITTQAGATPEVSREQLAEILGDPNRRPLAPG